MPSHSRHASGACQALYSAFVQPAVLSARAAGRPHLRRQLPQSRQHAIEPFCARRTFTSTFHPLAKTRGPEVRTQAWDTEIRAKWIYLIDPETGRRDPEPQTLYSTLRSYETKTHRLVQLSPEEPGNPDFVPVCKIVSKKESYEAEKRARQQKKEASKVSAREGSVKTLELNWAIDGNDLTHRLDRVREFLEEGRKVECVFAAKKRGRKASVEECEVLLRRIGEVVDEVQGAREGKALQGKMGGFATLTLEGKAQGKAV